MISETIRKLVEDFGVPPEDINKGRCEQFAKTLAAAVPGAEVILDEEEPVVLGDHRFFDPLSTRPLGHYVVKYENKYYDSECPDGVEKLFDLPVYGRAMRAKGLGRSEMTEKRDPVPSE